eukprot:12687882-Ditylum_brightwellii.AAC.1
MSINLQEEESYDSPSTLREKGKQFWERPKVKLVASTYASQKHKTQIILHTQPYGAWHPLNGFALNARSTLISKRPSAT